MVEPLAGVGLAEQCHGFRWHMKEQKKTNQQQIIMYEHEVTY